MTQSGHQRLRIAAVQPDPEPHFAGRNFAAIRRASRAMQLCIVLKKA
jgi:hypothetical protein